MSKEYLSSQSYKGTRDFFPKDKRLHRWMFDQMGKVVTSYGYEEYDGPMLEPFELYAAKTGEEIVNQQLYTLIDRGERKLAIRPEMTPTLARMVAQKIQELARPIRWYSVPNVWRYERPQRGRLREHWQLNVDVLGGETAFADAEIFHLVYDLITAFGGEKFISIRINHRNLTNCFFKDSLGLSPELALQLAKSIDAREKIGEEKYQAWIKDLGINDDQQKQMEVFFESSFDDIKRNYSCSGISDLDALFENLKNFPINSQIIFDPKVMRGMNYYTGVVFEVYDTCAENRRAMFGGGRYDDLLGLFGNTRLSGIGFGMGDVTLQHFLEVHKLLPQFQSAIDVFVTFPKQEFAQKAQEIVIDLRQKGFTVITPLEIGSFSQQLKVADKHEAHFAVLLGEQELAQNKVVIKNLKEGSQCAIDIVQVSDFLKGKCKSCQKIF
ncbi:MAG: histidine--tRNA ligase [Bdellovibrio sp.]|nr:histidine--tRNA ligase [Bdellovibrio sp.]